MTGKFTNEFKKQIFKFKNIEKDDQLPRIIDYLNNNTMYFATFESLNDPNEAFYYSEDGLMTLNGFFNIKELADRYKICSFTKKLNNLLLWSYYTNGLRGIAIGYKINKIIIKEQHIKDKLTYVKNAENLPKDHNLLFLKSADWKHEKEYRILVESPTAKEIILGKDCIASVTFGAKMCPHLASKIEVICNKLKPI